MGARHNRLPPLLALLALSLTASAADWKQGRCVVGLGRRAAAGGTLPPSPSRCPPPPRPPVLMARRLLPLCLAELATTALTGKGCTQLQLAYNQAPLRAVFCSISCSPHPYRLPAAAGPAPRWSIHKGNCGFGECSHGVPLEWSSVHTAAGATICSTHLP